MSWCWNYSFSLYRVGGSAFLWNLQKWPNLAENMHFWSFWAKYGHFWPIWSHAWPKIMQTRCVGGFSVTWVPKLLLPPVRIRIFGPKYAFLSTYRPCRLIWWLVIMARRLYLARHLSTLYIIKVCIDFQPLSGVFYQAAVIRVWWKMAFSSI